MNVYGFIKRRSFLSLSHTRVIRLQQFFRLDSVIALPPSNKEDKRKFKGNNAIKKNALLGRVRDRMT